MNEFEKARLNGIDRIQAVNLRIETLKQYQELLVPIGQKLTRKALSPSDMKEISEFIVNAETMLNGAITQLTHAKVKARI